MSADLTVSRVAVDVNFDKKSIAPWLRADIDTLKNLMVANESCNLAVPAGFSSALAALMNAECALDFVGSKTDPEQKYPNRRTITPGSNEELLVGGIREEIRLLRRRLLAAEKSPALREHTIGESLIEIGLPQDYEAPLALYAMRFDPLTFEGISGKTYPRLLRQLTLVSRKAPGGFDHYSTHGVLHAPTWLPIWLDRHGLLSLSLEESDRSLCLQEIDSGMTLPSEVELLQAAIDCWDPHGHMLWARDFNEAVTVCRKIWGL